VAALAIISFFAGAHSGFYNNSAAKRGHRVLYYVDPMHPQIRSDKPGLASDCGMPLVAVYEDQTQRFETPREAPPGAIRIAPEKQQLIGVRFAAVEKTPGERSVRTTGRVVADENRTFRLLAFTDGWIRNVFGARTGSHVQRGQLLATFYSRDVLTPQYAYFYALNALDGFRRDKMDSPEQIAATKAQITSAEEGLKAIGMGEGQILDIARKRAPASEIDLRAPATGLITARNVSPNLRFERGMEFFRIVDLSTVSVSADIFENEAQYFRHGAKVGIAIPQLHRTQEAIVSNDPPQFDAASRTLKIRLDAANTKGDLLPDMFVDVEFESQLPETLVVPEDAVLNSGAQKRVFVDRGDGYLEPVVVETGWQSGGRIQILKGLTLGERVASSATFLIDSESKIRSSGKRASSEEPEDAVCGMRLNGAVTVPKTWVAEFAGTHYYFCSEKCQRLFQSDPRRYLRIPA
jgi:RND family efflux transporter MFP subunit